MRNDTLIAYCSENTFLEIQDVFKYLYQSCLGCEHLVSDSSNALDRIRDELKAADMDDLPEIEMLDGDYCRVHLKAINERLSAEKLCGLFVLSAQTYADGRERLENELRNLISYAEDGLIPFKKEDVETAIFKWQQAGLEPVHHSASFREHHHPAYRVIRKEFLDRIKISI